MEINVGLLDKIEIMKKLFVIAVLCGSCVVSGWVGYQVAAQQSEKVYNEACRMSDLIRCYNDHLSEDSLIEDYGCFDELQGIFLYDDAMGDKIDLSDYTMTY